MADTTAVYPGTFDPMTLGHFDLIKRASKLYEYFKDKSRVAFGIGTYISNDTDVPALNIVMKVTKCNGQDVAKISDVQGKGMCKNEEYVD